MIRSMPIYGGVRIESFRTPPSPRIDSIQPVSDRIGSNGSNHPRPARNALRARHGNDLTATRYSR